MSLYDDLGVSPDATPEQLSAAYRAAAKKHHPDTGGDPEAFAKVGHAIAILRDPKRRAEYDRSGQEDFTDNHPDAEARSYLMGEFSQHWGAFLNAQISDWINIADMVRSGLDKKKRNQSDELVKARLLAARSKGARARLVHKGSGPDLIAAMLDQQEQMLSKTIIEMEQAVSALERACDLAKDWDWKTDPHPFGSAGNDQGLYRGHFFQFQTGGHL